MRVSLKVVQGTGSCFHTARFAAQMFLEPMPHQAVSSCCIFLDEGLVPHDAEIAPLACLSIDVPCMEACCALGVCSLQCRIVSH